MELGLTNEQKVEQAVLKTNKYLTPKAIAAETGLSEKAVARIMRRRAGLRVRMVLAESTVPVSCFDIRRKTNLNRTAIRYHLGALGAKQVDTRKTGLRGRPAILFAL